MTDIPECKLNMKLINRADKGIKMKDAANNTEEYEV